MSSNRILLSALLATVWKYQRKNLFLILHFHSFAKPHKLLKAVYYEMSVTGFLVLYKDYFDICIII